jgi:hypothetical protein
LFLLRLTGLQLPFRVLRTKPGPGIRSCPGAGRRDDMRQCVRRLLKRHTAWPVALRPLQCLIAGSVGAAALARQRGDRRRQGRTNVGNSRGLLATLCTRALLLPITAPGQLRGLQRPRATCLVGDRDGIGRPVGYHSAVQVCKDHVVCSRGLQLRWRTDPHGDWNVNGSRQQERGLRHLWRGKFVKSWREWWQKVFWNGRRRREVVIRVTEEDCRLLDEGTFLWNGWRNIVGNRIKVWRRFERSVQICKSTLAIAYMGALRVNTQVRPISCGRIEQACAPPD